MSLGSLHPEAGPGHWHRCVRHWGGHSGAAAPGGAQHTPAGLARRHEGPLWPLPGLRGLWRRHVPRPRGQGGAGGGQERGGRREEGGQGCQVAPVICGRSEPGIQPESPSLLDMYGR